MAEARRSEFRDFLEFFFFWESRPTTCQGVVRVPAYQASSVESGGLKQRLRMVISELQPKNNLTASLQVERSRIYSLLYLYHPSRWVFIKFVI